MKLSSREVKGVIILEPKGKIMGGPDSTLLHDQFHDLVQQNKKKIIVDLSKVERMNSTGLGILISGLTTKKNNQIKVPSDLDYLAEVDKFVEQKLKKTTLNKSQLADIAISVTEAVTNAMLH